MKTCSICQTAKPLDEYNRNKKKADCVQSYCRECQREYDRRYYKKSPKRQADRKDKANLRRLEIKIEVSSYKAKHGCVRCGESDDACLDFHHVDGKEENIATMISTGVGLDRIWEEVQKCVVLCSNCHRKLHAGRWQLGVKS